jgi:hypothetical protein
MLMTWVTWVLAIATLLLSGWALYRLGMMVGGSDDFNRRLRDELDLERIKHWETTEQLLELQEEYQRLYREKN